MFVDPQRLEVLDATTLTVRLANGKTERLNSVARVGNLAGWMVIEFTDGHQKLYSPYNVVSIEEAVQEAVEAKEKAAS
ncbi:MAG: hypothetical protein QHH75_11990 [Bacillota bacterium]|nr:hypothetical protein [Bacillota bacterium]